MPDLDTMNSDHDPRVSAVECGDLRVEYLKPDLSLAYSALAPLVSEAWAFLQCGNDIEAEKSLKRARAVIDTASTWTVIVESGDLNVSVDP